MIKGFKIGFYIIVILFFILFLAYHNGYYKDYRSNQKILTDEKIQEYEEDLKNGVDVSQKDYIVMKPNYDNVYTRFFLKLSKTIEKGFNKTIRYFFQK